MAQSAASTSASATTTPVVAAAGKGTKAQRADRPHITDQVGFYGVLKHIFTYYQTDIDFLENDEQPMTLQNWWKHFNLLNIFFIIGIPCIGMYQATKTPLMWQTCVWAVFYYFCTGIGITAGKLFATHGDDGKWRRNDGEKRGIFF